MHAQMVSSGKYVLDDESIALMIDTSHTTLLCDHPALCQYVSKEGRKDGRKEGRKEGRMEGRKEGRKDGREEGKRVSVVLIRVLDIYWVDFRQSNVMKNTSSYPRTTATA